MEEPTTFVSIASVPAGNKQAPSTAGGVDLEILAGDFGGPFSTMTAEEAVLPGDLEMMSKLEILAGDFDCGSAERETRPGDFGSLVAAREGDLEGTTFG